ncbi:hypothetical protein GC101_10235 [Paenibacillus sp. LMG 31459]|uniref:Glycosyltransferase 2-like domain-containing protein n=1 Tax=Paenibacillus phytohabitans TaxID=2654978 RepID=A0ABX1YE57_9BACL|nr:hypothetical protein [Paenibacillus phytohabitans]NOU79258.1 hypothetical protein [Paenibacillus phytohabitans]
MIAQLIWIVSIYASAAALVHILHRREESREARRPGKRLHYILITRNHEAVVEWYIRMLAVYAFWMGRPLYVTLMDDGSLDGTLAVASRLDCSGSSIRFAPVMPHYNTLGEAEHRKENVLDLRTQEQPFPLKMMRLPGSRGYGSKHGE